ncbi:MAG TPA: hypothetical protein VF692_05545, partial [Pyrinomonadaceae bacterium]
MKTMKKNAGKIFTFDSEKSFFLLARLTFCLIVCLIFAAAVSAQESVADDLTAPPPLKILSKTEKKQLDETPDIKKRTILGL